MSRGADDLNGDLARVLLCAWLWKMQCNAEKTEEVISSTKRGKPNHPVLMLGDDEVVRKTEHNHHGAILDDKLIFQSYVKLAILKARRGIGLVWDLPKYVPRHALDQIYKIYL